MKSWRYIARLSVIGLVSTLLVACSTSGTSGESDAPVETANVTQEAAAVVEKEEIGAEPQATAVQETPAAAEQGDETAAEATKESPTMEPDPTEVPEQPTEVPKPAFDPDRNPDGMVMVYVFEGEFEMGTSVEHRDRLLAEGIGEKAQYEWEQPIHTVYLDAFWIDQTEVTNGQYTLCVAHGACQEPHFVKSFTRENYYGNPEFSDFPVTFVDWSMAEAYCAWAGRRLPTEAEWEKAARGTDGRTYPWGEGVDETLANYGGYAREGGDTAAVGSYPDGASPYGALDMAGNIAEWVADEFDNRYYHSSPAENPPGPSLGTTMRVIRGGSWNGIKNSVRSASRHRYRADYRDFPDMGIRCAASP